MGCQKLAEHFSIGKTAISSIFKDSKNLWRYSEFFKGSYKNCIHGKYDLVNKIVYKWYEKWTIVNVGYTFAVFDGCVLQKEPIDIAKRLEEQELTEWMVRRVDTDKRRGKIMIVWRSRWGFHSNSKSLDLTNTRVAPGFWTMKHINFKQTWVIFFQSLTIEKFNEERKENQMWEEM